MAAKPTVPFSIRVDPETVLIARRHATLTGWSLAQLMESLLLGLEAKWVARLTPSERQRHEAGIMSRLEFEQICYREKDAVWREQESYRRPPRTEEPSMKVPTEKAPELETAA
jgi:hypothetical protein